MAALKRLRVWRTSAGFGFKRVRVDHDGPSTVVLHLERCVNEGTVPVRLTPQSDHKAAQSRPRS